MSESCKLFCSYWGNSWQTQSRCKKPECNSSCIGQEFLQVVLATVDPILSSFPSRCNPPFKSLQSCCVHCSAIWEVANGVDEFSPWQRRARSVRIWSNGLRVVDGVAGPVHWCAIWQVACYRHRANTDKRENERKERGREYERKTAKLFVQFVRNSILFKIAYLEAEFI